MKIIYHDGSILRCSSLHFTEKKVIADDFYIIPTAEILSVEIVEGELIIWMK